MKNKELVIYNSKIIYIDRYIYESDEMFYFRINYIFNKLDDNIDINELIGLSMIELYKKFLNCDY
jgi:hypothetical protein